VHYPSRAHSRPERYRKSSRRGRRARWPLSHLPDHQIALMLINSHIQVRRSLWCPLPLRERATQWCRKFGWVRVMQTPHPRSLLNSRSSPLPQRALP